MANLKSFRLPSFALTVRELTDSERAKQADFSRDWLAVTIRDNASNDSLTVIVGSPVYGDWNETKAARSAISFASEPSAWDDETAREWVETHGETLETEAFNHGVLGKELRK